MAKYIIIPLLVLILAFRFITLDKVELKDGQDLSFQQDLLKSRMSKTAGKHSLFFTKETGFILSFQGKVNIVMET